MKPEIWYENFNKWSWFPKDDPAATFASENEGFVYADIAYCNEFTYMDRDDPVKRRLEFSFFPFLITNMQNDLDYVQMIKDVRAITDNSVFENADKGKKGLAFPYSDIITYWSVFLDTEAIMWRALGINYVIIFVCTLFFLKSFAVAVMTVFMCAMIVL